MQIVNVLCAKLTNYYQMTKELEKKSFFDLYNEAKSEPTPAQKFVKEVANLTDRSEGTVRMWLAGVQIPDPNVSRVIGMHFGVDADALFERD